MMRKNKQLLSLYAILMVLSYSQTFSQTGSSNAETLTVIEKMAVFKQIIISDSNQKMINIQILIPALVLDLRYATANNFVHQNLYPAKTNFTFLRLPVAKELQKVQQELNTKGLGLKIFDAYRPYSVTKKFWELIHDERYVANPAKGSGHNRGITVDLTIINLQTGIELNMGTGFDNFTDSAHHSFTDLSSDILNNRKLLKEIMEKYGFIKMNTEWWHYSWPHPEKFDVLNLSFKELKKATD